MEVAGLSAVPSREMLQLFPVSFTVRTSQFTQCDLWFCCCCNQSVAGILVKKYFHRISNLNFFWYFFLWKQYTFPHLFQDIFQNQLSLQLSAFFVFRVLRLTSSVLSFLSTIIYHQPILCKCPTPMQILLLHTILLLSYTVPQLSGHLCHLSWEANHIPQHC